VKPARLISRLASRWTDRRAATRLSWVADRLAVGAAGSSVEALRAAGIAAVIDARAEAPPDELARLAHAGFDTLAVPIVEHEAPTRQQLQTATAWAAERLAAGRPVLVQCRAGIGRSAAIALAILVAQGVPPLAAQGLLQRARAVARPTSDQLEAVLDFARDAHNRPT
jgi:protein tyrosine phosphatase (PTP) superfamily phosphohydrolase (DUF442 family)